MPARDIFHNAVKKGLQKEGWKITHDPLPVSFELGDMYIDLGAERILAAEREGEKIAVEIKSFFKTSAISEFHTALGQFINYRLALSEQEPDRTLYLAVPIDTYTSFFTIRLVQNTKVLNVKKNPIKTAQNMLDFGRKIKVYLFDSDYKFISQDCQRYLKRTAKKRLSSIE